MSVKNFIRTWVYKTAHNDFWYENLWHPLGRLTQLASREHQRKSLVLGDELGEAQASLLADLRVRSGPFEGLIYPNAVATGSSLLPKLIGSYEQELQPVIASVIEAQPKRIIDIGSAEGYYAVGMALKIPEAEIIAYDTDSTGQDCCRKMASCNGVANRVDVRSSCTREELLKFGGNSTFVLSDCEGAENFLFNSQVANELSAASVLIEAHDFIRPSTTRRMLECFRPTHEVVVIRSVPDLLRPVIYPHASIAIYSADVQIALMEELRPANMNWIYCRPKVRHGSPPSPLTAIVTN